MRRDRVDVRRGVGPDEQDAAGGVIDDEACGRAEAAWTQARVVAVAREDEQVRVLGGADDLALDAAAA